MLSWRKLMGMEPDVAGKSGGKAPAPPDYASAAKAQGEANLEAIRAGAALNRVNQVTPYGTVRYEQGGPSGSGPRVTIPQTPTGLSIQSASPSASVNGGGISGTIADALRNYYAARPGAQPTMPTTASSAPAGSDQWTQYTELSPDQQRIFDQGEQTQFDLGRIASGRLGQFGNQGELSFAGQPSRVTNLDLSGQPQLPGDLSAERQRVEDALYGRASRFLDPQFQREEEAARTRLLNSGNVEGSEGWNNAMADLARRKEAAYGDARDRSILAGGEETSRTLSDALRTRQQGVTEGLTDASLTNAARDAGINETLMLRDRPLQEFLQLYSGNSAGMTPPAIPQAGTPIPEDILGATQAGYQGRIDQYSANQARNAQNTNSLLNLAAIFALSDRRMKRDIELLGVLPNGIPTYRFRYLDAEDVHVGVMSDEVHERFPDAVIVGADGFDRVNYAAIGAAHLLETH